jgi:polysaccharide export outer membrane protein
MKTLLPVFLLGIALCASAGKDAPTTYTLGPGDQVLVKVLDVEEISADKTPVRIDTRGGIVLPMVGRIQAAGLTTEQLQVEIATRLAKYVRDPNVSVYLVEMRSQPISILGAVMQPGVHQLEGRKTLFEALSLAGGLKPDAGYSVKITRKLEWGRIPLPTAQDDATGRFSVATVSVKSIMEAKNPQENIQIQPEDVISVPRADLVYVVGAVRRSGGFVLGERETISALQALSLAEGLDRFAAPKKAKIMRAVPGSETRTEIAVDLNRIVTGKGPDVPLRAEDILFIPVNAAKSATVRTLEVAIPTAATAAVYRIP